MSPTSSSPPAMAHWTDGRNSAPRRSRPWIPPADWPGSHRRGPLRWARIPAWRARVAATEAFSTVAAEGIQLHGGIAITWEHDMQLYFKRAHGSSQLLGPASEHVRRLESEVFSSGDDAEGAAR